MKKLAVLCIAALGAALLVLGTAPAASAYPDLSCNVSVDRQVVKPGQTFTAFGETPVAVDASNHPVADANIHWTFTWNGETKARTGHTVQASFTAPDVKKTRKITLTAKNSTPVGDCIKHIDITVIGSTVIPNTGGGSGLPSTGGPALWILVAGLALLLGGGGAVVAARRRS